MTLVADAVVASTTVNAIITIGSFDVLKDSKKMTLQPQALLSF
jgi:hypothetical protein